MKYSIKINARGDAGITAAREAYNDELQAHNPNGPFETNAEYMQYVMESAAESYARQHLTD